MGAKRLIAVVPYFAYARQHKRYRTGETVSGEVCVHLLEEAGADVFLTVDIHNPQLLDMFTIRTLNLTAMPTIGQWFAQLRLKRPFVLGPDPEAAERARLVADELGCESSWLAKERHRVTGRIKTWIYHKLNVQGRDVVIVDDIISTGSTMLNAIKIVKRAGARRIWVGCTHPILAHDALERIRQAGAKSVVGTNSVPSEVSQISLAPLIARGLKALFQTIP
jgi:ribose-phosphate pyrophosphokinase